MGTGRKRHTIFVGVEEADPERGSISWLSPLARALLSRRAGDKVRFRSPAGDEELTIMTVRYSGVSHGEQPALAPPAPFCDGADAHQCLANCCSRGVGPGQGTRNRDRKSTRLNSSHANISYAVFC